MKKYLLLFVLILFPNSPAQTPEWELLGLENEGINDIAIDDSGNVYVAALSGIFKSVDNGLSWIPKNNGLDDIIGAQKLFIDYNGNILLAAIGRFHDGLYKSTDGAENWVRIVDTLGISIKQFDDIVVIPNEHGGFIYVANNRDGIFRSTDNGISWQTTNFTDPGAKFIGINLNGYMFFGNNTASWFGIYRSIDLGLNWVRHTLLGVSSMVYLSDGSILAGCYDPGLGTFGIYKTTDNGDTWFNTNTFSGLAYPSDLVLDTNEDIYVYIDGVYLSTNNGGSWINFGLSEYSVTSLAIDSSGYVWAGTFFNGIYRTAGRTVPVELVSFTADINNNNIILKWITATEMNNQGFEIQRASSSTSPRREDWVTIGFVEGDGTTTETKFYSFIDENVSNGTYFYRLKQIDFDGTFEYSDVIEVSVNVSEGFELYQNYPNPFNPKTTIKFSLDEIAVISMDLYSILGEKITSIITDEKYNPGIYEIEFESKDIPSGVYLYELKADERSAVNKLIIIK